MTRLEAEIIVGLAENNLKPEKTAERMACHVNTVRYHLEKIKKETGADPKSFYDLCRLLPIAEELLWGRSEDIGDAELVTRCRDCKYWLRDFGEVCSREEDWFYMAPDDFCSRSVVRNPQKKRK